MTRTTVQAENYELKIQRAMVGVKQLVPNLFTVPSASESAPHIVTTNADGQANYCSCKGWHDWGHCYHGIATTRFVAARQQVKAAEEIVKQSQAPREFVGVPEGGLVLRSAERSTAGPGVAVDLLSAPALI